MPSKFKWDFFQYILGLVKENVILEAVSCTETEIISIPESPDSNSLKNFVHKTLTFMLMFLNIHKI